MAAARTRSSSTKACASRCTSGRSCRGLLGQAPTYPAGLNGTFELAIDLPTSADADRVYAQVIAAGAQPVYAPRDEPWGMHSSMIADPEGNLIEIGSWNRGAGA